MSGHTGYERCACGERVTTLDYDTSRGVTYVPSNRTEAPLTLTCASGHSWTTWITADHANELFEIKRGAQ